MIVEYIKKVRKERNLAQWEIAMDCDLAYTQYSDIERRKRDFTLYILEKLQDGIGFDVCIDGKPLRLDTFGDIVKSKRLELGIARSHFGGLSNTAIKEIEEKISAPKFKTIQKIADVLGMKLTIVPR